MVVEGDGERGGGGSEQDNERQRERERERERARESSTERTRLKVVVADNPVNFESIHCCGFLHSVKPEVFPVGGGRFS